jgi:hypothetical protein
MRRHRTRLALTVPMLALVLAAIPACTRRPGSGVASANGSGGPSAAPSDSAAAGLDQGRRFAQCVRNNGIPNYPDPNPDGTISSLPSGTDAGLVQRVLNACQHLMPAGTAGGPQDPQQLARLRAFAKCMRDNGVNVPDPDPNAPGGAAVGALPGANQNDPKVRKAVDTCQRKVGLPAGPGATP